MAAVSGFHRASCRCQLRHFFCMFRRTPAMHASARRVVSCNNAVAEVSWRVLATASADQDDSPEDTDGLYGGSSA
jgi:hypothetical protein